MKYLLALLLFISSGVLTAQEVTSTGNIVDPTKWNNVIPMTGSQLSQVEGTGGGPLPAYNLDTNTIRFSYFQYTASQIIAINSVLSGQGISVGGFNYSWSIYNDLLNCCGTRGSLLGTVNFADSSGNILKSYTYDYSSLNTGANFQKITGTETFTNPYQLSSLGYVGVAWTGKDQNFWSGYYGPRVRDTEITLNYTVASPTPTSTTSTPTTTDNSTQTTTTEIIAKAAEPIPTTTVTPTSSTTTEPVIASTTSTPTNTTSTATNSTIPAVIKDETVVAKESTTVEKSSTSGPSLSSILSNIKSNQDRQQNIAMAAVASSIEVANAVTQKAEQLAVETASTSAQQALQTASDSSNISSSNKTNSNITMAESNQGNNTTTNTQTNVIVATVNNPTFSLFAKSDSKTGSENTSTNTDLPVRPQSSTITQTTSLGQIDLTSRPQTNIVTSTNVGQLDFTLKPQTSVSTSSNIGQLDFTLKPQTNIATSTYVAPSLSLTRPENRITENIVDTQITLQEIKPVIRQSTIDIFANANNTNTTNSTIAFGRRGDPIQDYVEANNNAFNEMKAESKPTTVRANAQDNDIAGGVRIERMAVVPAGFNAYTNQSLSNIAFYEPKEIYKNQKVIDNARALRQLSSDRLHQEMVEQQYRR